MSATARLSARILPVADLDPVQVAAMFELYARYYGAAEPERFYGDLAEKDEALLLSDDEGAVRGFTTLKWFALAEGPRVLFSGDTLIDHRYWGEQGLAFTWIRRAGELKARDPAQPLYWFLIVKGHRTYRYLQAFSLNYYPHWARPTPDPIRQLMERLARERFGEHYDPGSGVVRFPSSHGHLLPAWAGASAEELARPEVRYFYTRNPGHHRGDELVCLTELHPENLRPLARRIFLQGMGR